MPGYWSLPYKCWLRARPCRLLVPGHWFLEVFQSHGRLHAKPLASSFFSLVPGPRTLAARQLQALGPECSVLSALSSSSGLSRVPSRLQLPGPRRSLGRRNEQSHVGPWGAHSWWQGPDLAWQALGGFGWMPRSWRWQRDCGPHARGARADSESQQGSRGRLLSGTNC